MAASVCAARSPSPIIEKSGASATCPAMNANRVPLASAMWLNPGAGCSSLGLINSRLVLNDRSLCVGLLVACVGDRVQRVQARLVRRVSRDQRLDLLVAGRHSALLQRRPDQRLDLVHRDSSSSSSFTNGGTCRCQLVSRWYASPTPSTSPSSNGRPAT